MTRQEKETLVQTRKICPDLLCSIDICRAIQVWGLRRKEGNNAQQLGWEIGRVNKTVVVVM